MTESSDYKAIKSDLSIVLDNERWKVYDVPPEIQFLVDYICDNGENSEPNFYQGLLQGFILFCLKRFVNTS